MICQHTNSKRRAFRKTALAVAAMIVAGTATLQQAEAASCTRNPATGNWGSAGNWSCAIVPTGPANDSATVAAGKTVTALLATMAFHLDGKSDEAVALFGRAQ